MFPGVHHITVSSHQHGAYANSSQYYTKSGSSWFETAALYKYLLVLVTRLPIIISFGLDYKGLQPGMAAQPISY